MIKRIGKLIFPVIKQKVLNLYSDVKAAADCLPVFNGILRGIMLIFNKIVFGWNVTYKNELRKDNSKTFRETKSLIRNENEIKKIKKIIPVGSMLQWYGRDVEQSAHVVV